MDNEVSYQKIRSYLLGQLTPEQVKDFEEKLASDSGLAEEVELHRNLIPALDRLKERALQANFQKWRKEFEEEKISSQIKRFHWYYVVIPVILLLTGLWFSLRNSTGLNKKNEVWPLDTLQPRNTLPLQKDPITIPEPATSVDDPATIAAIKSLSDEYLTININFQKNFEVLGENNDNGWKMQIMKADSEAESQNFQKALDLLKSLNNIPEAHALIYSRQAYLNFKLGNFETAISNYREYMKWDGDTDKTYWQEALYLLADYNDHQREFWEKLDYILELPDHKHYEDAKSLAAQLKSLGVRH